MADKTGIEWTDATWNPVTGCTKVSQGCKFCYAKHQAWARLAAMPNTVYAGREFEQVMCHPERLDQPLRWTKPRMIFVNSMSDLFHPDVPDVFIDRVFAVMALAQQHVFQVLTKRPDRMLRYFMHHFTRSKCSRCAAEISGRRDSVGGGDIRVSDGPFPLPNVWLGVSVEDQAAADERVPLLLQAPAAVRWASVEPLLGPVELIGLSAHFDKHRNWRAGAGLDWVVVGGESGHGARPMHPAWARSLRDQCAAANVPFLFKQWGEWAPREPYASELMESDELCGKWDGVSYRYGKKGAGRLLDGVQHDGYPETTECAHRNAP